MKFSRQSISAKAWSIHASLLNAEASNLVFLDRYNTEFDEIIITFTDQNGRLLQIEDKINLALLINK